MWWSICPSWVAEGFPDPHCIDFGRSGYNVQWKKQEQFNMKMLYDLHGIDGHMIIPSAQRNPYGKTGSWFWNVSKSVDLLKTCIVFIHESSGLIICSLLLKNIEYHITEIIIPGVANEPVTQKFLFWKYRLLHLSLVIIRNNVFGTADSICCVLDCMKALEQFVYNLPFNVIIRTVLFGQGCPIVLGSCDLFAWYVNLLAYSSLL